MSFIITDAAVISARLGIRYWWNRFEVGEQNEREQD